jgi:hypothetical protein
MLRRLKNGFRAITGKQPTNPPPVEEHSSESWMRVDKDGNAYDAGESDDENVEIDPSPALTEEDKKLLEDFERLLESSESDNADLDTESISSEQWAEMEAEAARQVEEPPLSSEFKNVRSAAMILSEPIRRKGDPTDAELLAEFDALSDSEPDSEPVPARKTPRKK